MKPNQLKLSVFVLRACDNGPYADFQNWGANLWYFGKRGAKVRNIFKGKLGVGNDLLAKNCLILKYFYQTGGAFAPPYPLCVLPWSILSPVD